MKAVSPPRGGPHGRAAAVEPGARVADRPRRRPGCRTSDRPTLACLASRRALDVLIIVLTLPFALIVGGLIAGAILVDSPGPIFYRSWRVGHGGRLFCMLKFRKMRRDAYGPSLTRLDDDRFTPLGSWLAMTRLDELPQIWNVLRGEMRLVGPRPEVAEFVGLYRDPYREILSVVPGITGLAQLEFASERRLFSAADLTVHYGKQILPRKIQLDLQYVKRQSLALDVAILARTVLLPLRLVAAPTRRWLVGIAARRPVVIAGACALLLALFFSLQAVAPFS